MTLTARERKVIVALQNGAEIITDCNYSGAWISGGKEVKDWHFGNKVFESLFYEKKLIGQELHYPFEWELTRKGVLAKI